MSIQLIKGSFEASEASEIIKKMIQVKIKFHEQKINHLSIEEDIKFREGRIKQLQKDLLEITNSLKEKKGLINIHAEITVS
jgi:hypothetical protein